MLISCANWVLKVSTEWALVGQVVTLGDSPRVKGRSIAVLVCHNVLEAVLTC